MKILTANKAATMIPNNATIALGGLGGAGCPDVVLQAIEKRFLKTKSPSGLTIFSGVAPGNLTEDNVGMNCFAHDGMVKKAICSHLGCGRNFGEKVRANKFPAFNIPLSVYGNLLRAVSSGQVGFFTHIGLNTFADPRIEGCRANESAKKSEDIVELINICGKDQLFYKAFPINVAIIKASYADIDGNITCREEGAIGEYFEAAAAAHNSGGIVIVQVKGILPKNSLKSKDVLIPKHLVDYVVVGQVSTAYGDYNLPIYRPEVAGEIKIIEDDDSEIQPLNERKICARRAYMEIKKNSLVNLGIGMPDQVGFIAKEEGCYEDISISVESGTIGGVPLSAMSFGASKNTEAIIPTTNALDLYDGGALDIAILGCGEVDQEGNVNVSKLSGNRVTGPGGFIDITQTTKKIIFIGTMTTGGLKVSVEHGKLKILQEGKYTKFKKVVNQITMSGKYAKELKQEILYVTERAVFKLTAKGIELIEVAPGIDYKTQVLPFMEFKPIIAKDLKTMNSKIFKMAKMNIKLK